MTLLHHDGFDGQDYVSRVDYTFKSGSGSLQSDTRYPGGICWGWTNNVGTTPLLRKDVPASDELFVGFAYRSASGSDANNLIALYGDSGAILHIGVRHMSNGALAAYRGATQIALTSPNVFPFGFWGYLEVGVTIDDTTGTCVVRLNEATVINFTGDTKNAGTNTSIDAIILNNNGASSGNMRFDDFYVCDGLGSANNGFLGEVRSLPMWPTADGVHADLVPSTGTSHFALVDETGPPSATDYNSSATPGDQETYVLGDLPGGVTTVFGLSSVVHAKKTDSGARSFKHLLRSGGADYVSADVVLSASSQSMPKIYETDPATSAAWTPTNVNALQAGIEVV